MSHKEREKGGKGSHLYLALAAVAVVLTLYFMPKSKLQQYEFALGKPWTYNELIAPFNFSIEKSEEEYSADKDSLRTSFAPYFKSVESAGAEALLELEKLYNDTMRSSIAPHTFRRLRDRLEEIYTDGIMADSTADQLSGSGSMTLRVYQGNYMKNIPKRRVRSVKAAYEYLLGIDISEHDLLMIRRFDMEQYLRPNLVYDSVKSENELQEIEGLVSRYKGMVVSEQKIIDHGEIITPEKYQIIKSYINNCTLGSESDQFLLFTRAGQFLLVAIMFLLLCYYLNTYRREYVESNRKLLFFFGTICFFILITEFYVQYTEWSIFIIPCVMLPLLLRLFLDSRTAFMGFLMYVLVSSMMVTVSIEFVLLQTTAGLVGIYSIRELSLRSQILRCALLIFLAYAVVWTAVQLIQTEDISHFNYQIYIYFAINTLLLLLIYPLLYFIEKGFGFTSNVTLIELSNINHPLLRELSEKAQGTFQHSMQVSVLAAEAANRIGAQAQLVRTAALYHDVGKINNPTYFVENQNGVNPHDTLSPEESSRILVQHVKDGLRIAGEYGLPVVIKEFIISHHGNGVTKYFLGKFKQEHPEEEVDLSKFRYDGINPTTKEAAILMMADACEAASRSLKEHTEESIGNLTDKIIDTQAMEGFFKETPLTFHEIEEIKEVFKEKLKTMYHTRISYPDTK